MHAFTRTTASIVLQLIPVNRPHSPSWWIQMLSAEVKARKQQYMPPLSKYCDVVVSTSPICPRRPPARESNSRYASNDTSSSSGGGSDGSEQTMTTESQKVITRMLRRGVRQQRGRVPEVERGSSGGAQHFEKCVAFLGRLLVPDLAHLDDLDRTE